MAVILATLIALVGFMLITVLEFGALATLRWKLGWKRQAIKSSLQYNEAKVSLLWQLYEEYQGAEEPHKAALVKRMMVEASRIPGTQVPPEIRSIILRR